MKLYSLIEKEVKRLLYHGKKDDALRLIISATNLSREECEKILNTFPESNLKEVSPEEENFYYKKELEELKVISENLATSRGETLDYRLKQVAHVQKNVEESLRRSEIKVNSLTKSLISNKGLENYLKLLEKFELEEKANEINIEQKYSLIKNAKEEFLKQHWDISTISLSDSQKCLELGIINEKQHSVVFDRFETEKEKMEGDRVILEQKVLRRKKEFYVNYILGRIILKKDNPIKERIDKIEGNKTDCFVVTATMGYNYHPVVLDYRIYRDEILSKTFIGRILIKTYYMVGPLFAFVIKKNRILFNISKTIVLKVHKHISQKLQLNSIAK